MYSIKSKNVILVHAKTSAIHHSVLYGVTNESLKEKEIGKSEFFLIYNQSNVLFILFNCKIIYLSITYNNWEIYLNSNVILIKYTSIKQQHFE